MDGQMSIKFLNNFKTGLYIMEWKERSHYNQYVLLPGLAIIKMYRGRYYIYICNDYFVLMISFCNIYC